MNLAECTTKYRTFVKNSPPGGGLAPVNAALFYHLLGAQKAKSIKGDLFEIGVWHGYTSALLADSLENGESLGICDPFMTREIFLPPIQSFTARQESRILFWRDSSFTLRRNMESFSPMGDLRFVHIDGEHSYEAIENDFLLIERKLHDFGILVYDDIFFSSAPQLTDALFSLLKKYRSEICMFAVGLNKAYLCRPRALPYYRNVIREAPQALEEASEYLRVFAASWSAETPYYGIAPRDPGSPRYCVFNKFTDDASLLP